jgi:hypothetical protein
LVDIPNIAPLGPALGAANGSEPDPPEPDPPDPEPPDPVPEPVLTPMQPTVTRAANITTVMPKLEINRWLRFLPGPAIAARGPFVSPVFRRFTLWTAMARLAENPPLSQLVLDSTKGLLNKYFRPVR